jgi:hypothetical protein
MRQRQAVGRVAFICATVALGASSAAYAAEAHVHGVARLDVAVEGEGLQLGFESPLDNLVGFERAPRTDREKQAIRAMASRFADAQSLFAPTAAARCTVAGVKLSSPVIDAPLLDVGANQGAAAGGTKAKPDEDGHAELAAEISFRCEKPQELRSLEARVFAPFPGIHALEVQVAGPRGQAAAKLTPSNRVVTF